MAAVWSMLAHKQANGISPMVTPVVVVMEFTRGKHTGWFCAYEDYIARPSYASTGGESIATTESKPSPGMIAMLRNLLAQGTPMLALLRYEQASLLALFPGNKKKLHRTAIIKLWWNHSWQQRVDIPYLLKQTTNCYYNYILLCILLR